VCLSLDQLQELEEALLTEEVCVGGGLLQELLLRLLAGCEGAEKHELSSSNYQMFLRRLFRRKCQVNERLLLLRTLSPPTQASLLPTLMLMLLLVSSGGRDSEEPF